MDKLLLLQYLTVIVELLYIHVQVLNIIVVQK